MLQRFIFCIICLQFSLFAAGQARTAPPEQANQAGVPSGQPKNVADAAREVTANAPHLSAAGPITLQVDATQVAMKILHAHLTIPVSGGGETTLVYPKWIPGEHMPSGPITDLAGLKFTAGGRPLVWRRDLTDMWALHVATGGANQIEADLDFLSPASGSFSGGASSTATLTVISWNQLLLYPQGTAAHDVTFRLSLKLPRGWKFGTALPGAAQSGDTINFAPVPLETLVDSPVIAGEHYRAIDITPPGEALHHEIDMASDSDAALDMPAETIHDYKQLIAETGALYGARHYRDYHFLLTLSDQVAHFGLEHHESSDDRVDERSLLDDGARMLMGGLLPHEMTHSWNGKYRRPADLATPNYQVPMEDDLLWVYEGLTEYLGDVLAARSGLWTDEQYRENLAAVAAGLDNRPGRTWRPLLDTTIGAVFLYDAPGAWSSWRRGTDFYDEGELIWLEVDTIIRKQTNNAKTIDDFVHLFHGGQNTPPMVKPYTFDDVVNALNQVAPYDWRRHFTERLTSLSAHAPLGGITNGGWLLVYNDTPNTIMRAQDAGGGANLAYSLGLLLSREGRVADCIMNSPAYQAGISPGMTIVAVNGRRFSPDVIHDALAAGSNGSAPLELLVENSDYFKSVRVDYHGGNRYPHLVRQANEPDLLGQIIKQHAASVPAGEPQMGAPTIR
ncbi:MAG TPA: M61 family peptidase [Terriglobales bacterium]|nr:M61 family peptidase [Terriglobales bacterium]